MSDLSTTGAAPDWDADDEKTFYEIIAEMKRSHEWMRLMDSRIAQVQAESAAITAENSRRLTEINARLDRLERQPEVSPRRSDSERSAIDRENAFLRLEVERLSKEKNIAPLFADFLAPRA